jgi:hypothetical protein
VFEAGRTLDQQHAPRPLGGSTSALPALFSGTASPAPPGSPRVDGRRRAGGATWNTSRNGTPSPAGVTFGAPGWGGRSRAAAARTAAPVIAVAHRGHGQSTRESSSTASAVVTLVTSRSRPTVGEPKPIA